ncbi:MAG: hypothetical protein SGILL_010170, partial [Bacillariaceae sp.]
WVTLTVELIFAIWLLALKMKIDGFEGCGSKSSNKTVGRDEKEDMSAHTELEAMEMGSVGFNDGQLAICVDGNVDLTRKIDSLTYKDAIRFRHNSSIGPETLVKDAYRGFHIMIDVVFTIDLDPEFGKALLARMCELAKMHKVRVVHDHIEIFDGEVSPPGFAAVALLDESHMSAHCYSDQGKLAFDVFTCGANPDCTRKVARDVLFYLRQHLGSEAKYQIHRLPRFPVHSNTESTCCSSSSTS